MKPGMDLKIEKDDEGVRGVKIFGEDDQLIEFISFTQDGEWLDSNGRYNRAYFEPIRNVSEAQVVVVS